MFNSFRAPLVTGAIAGLLGVLMLPSLVGTEAEQLDAIRGAGTRFLAGNSLTFLGTALIGVGLALLGVRLRATSRPVIGVLAMVAGSGWLMHTALIAHNAVMYEVAQMDDRSAAAEVAESVFAGPVFVAILLPMLLASVLGTIILAVTLWRVEAAPIWAATAIVVGLVSDLVMPEGTIPSGSPLFLLLAVGFAGITVEKVQTRGIPAFEGSSVPASDIQ